MKKEAFSLLTILRNIVCVILALLVVLSAPTYNRYYLAELEDGSWLCVYFDDYLVLMGADNYPTGYVRYTTTEERRMLNQMAEDYDVDPVYVLDMYRHGKVSWMLDLGLRLWYWLLLAC